MIYNNTIEYDKYGRVIFLKILEPEMSYRYRYYNSGRTCIIESSQNKSNYKTVSHQVLLGEKYVDKKVIQYGEKYDIEIKYDLQGKEIEIIRRNKVDNTNYKKTTYRNKEGESIIWFEKYNDSSNVGFKVNLDILKNKL
jgi:hypothetical protein